MSAFWRWHRPEGPDDVINDLEKSDSLYLFSLPQNPRTPSESGKQQFPWGEATSSCRRCLWVSQYLKTLQSQNLARQKQVLYVYTGNKIIRVLSTAVSLAESLPGTLGGSHSPALRNQNYPSNATPGAAPSPAASGHVPVILEVKGSSTLRGVVTSIRRIDPSCTAPTERPGQEGF